MKAIDKNTWFAMTLVASITLAVAGCGSDYQNYEQAFVSSGMCSESAPEWVKGPMPNDPENLYFLGRGLSYNILDERAGYDGARDHVLEQMGKQIATWVRSRVARGDRRLFGMETGWAFLGLVQGHAGRGRFLPGERARQRLDTAIAMTTQALAGDLEDRAIHWEQWGIREIKDRPFEKPLRMKRYKCWLLMSIPRAKVDARIKATFEALHVAATGRLPDGRCIGSGKNWGLTPTHEKIGPGVPIPPGGVR